MRAGKLDRIITIQAFTTTVDELGTPTEDWTEFATLRAQIVTSSAEEFLRAYGENHATATVFRCRFQSGVTPEHRVIYDGIALNVREVTEIGRRAGLELRCDQVRS